MSDEFERGLLGAVLSGYRDIRELGRTVSGSDFRDPWHETIWQAALELHAEGKPAGPYEVMHAMGNEAHRMPGGATYLTDLQSQVQVVAQAPFYAQQVRDGSIRRQIAGLGQRCAQIVADVDTEPADLVARIRAWADEIGTAPTRETTTVGEVLEKVIDIAQHGQPNGQPTPWADLTHLLRGWFPGQLVTFGARPGVGKTLALENVATHAARAGDWVLFVSLEMSPEEVLLRTMAHTASVNLTSLQRGALTERDWDSVNRNSAVIESTRIRFADQPSQTLATIRANVADLAQEAKRKGERLGMVVVDYIQLITPTVRRGESRQQQLGAITRGLKLLAREFDVPVITAAQLNRAPMSRSNPMPMLSDLREAGDIEQDSNVVILMHEETVDDNGQQLPTGEIKLVIAKNRNGPRGVVSLNRYGHYAKLSAA